MAGSKFFNSKIVINFAGKQVYLGRIWSTNGMFGQCCGNNSICNQPCTRNYPITKLWSLLSVVLSIITSITFKVITNFEWVYFSRVDRRGYRCWDFNNKVIISCHVRFFENIFTHKTLMKTGLSRKIKNQNASVFHFFFIQHHQLWHCPTRFSDKGILLVEQWNHKFFLVDCWPTP